MDCLEFNIRQLILTDIATNIAEHSHDASKQSVSSVIDLVTSQVDKIDVVAEVSGNEEESVFMSTSRIQCNIGFAELAVNLSDEYIATTIPVLIDMLHDIPYISFDKCMAWDNWALPDQLVFATVSSLLRLATIHADYSEAILGAVLSFSSNIVAKLQGKKPAELLAQFAPSFHGFYRALTSTTYAWSPQHWIRLSKSLNPIFTPSVVESLNRLVADVVGLEETNPDTVDFISSLMARYISRGRPLSGYFLVCSVIEMQWTVLAQALADTAPASQFGEYEAAAANNAWTSLLESAEIDAKKFGADFSNALKETLELSMQTFANLLVQIEEMESPPSNDSYAWETISESLKLSAVCSAALDTIDENLLNELKLLLSEQSPVSDHLVQEAALKSIAVLVKNFPKLAYTMATHVRRFVTYPLPIFEHEFGTIRTSPPLIAAAKCLALCIRLAPGDDVVLSHMYSLLNYIAATSKETSEHSMGVHFHGGDGPADHVTLHSLESGLSDEEKRLIGISTISVVTRLALEFQQDEVTRLTVSMLLQCLRVAEPTVEAAIAYNLADLALTAPDGVFEDIISAFSAINRSANPDDPRFSNNMVLASQTRLAHEMHQKPNMYETYLVELLTLFTDKGVAIQNVAVSVQSVKADDMIEQLASLLLPIDALLAHKDFNPQFNASGEMTALFRNMWFLCTLFHFTSYEEKEQVAMDWLKPVLGRIAIKSPIIVLEEAHDTMISDLEYNTVIRHEYAHTVISKHRSIIAKHIALRASEIRNLHYGQVIFLLTMHDLESLRSAAGIPSSLASYFTNASLNTNIGLSGCMESIAEKVIRGSINLLTIKAGRQALPAGLSLDLRTLLVSSTHRIAKAREIALSYLNRLITSFPSLMCDPPLVFAMLEVLTLLRHACENEFKDEFNPKYEFFSERVDITLHLVDNYAVRNEILAVLQRHANNWFELALGRAPIELQATLQKYLSINQIMSPAESAELGASVAGRFAKALGSAERKLNSLASIATWHSDRTKAMSSQIVSKAYFSGEIAGLRLSRRSGQNELDKPQAKLAPLPEVDALKARLAKALEGIRAKDSHLTVRDLKHLLFRCGAALISVTKCDYNLLRYMVCLPFEVFTPSAISAGIEVWTWVISEKPEFEIGVMMEINSAWLSSVKHERGMFSTTMNHDDPFYHPISYSPTDKEEIDRRARNSRRLLTPHVLVLQMLLSRLQAARYRRPGLMLLIQRLVLTSARAHRYISTHPLAREARFSFLLFGFETLKCCHLGSYCEYALRECLYSAAFAWFTVRPLWSYGSNRIQVHTDIKLLSEFLSYLQTDSLRSSMSITSLSPPVRFPNKSARLKDLNLALRLLVENEILRLTVWSNPTNDPKRGTDSFSTTERTMNDATWISVVRLTWQIDPAITVYLPERFMLPVVHNEVTRCVRSNTTAVLDVPDALRFLVGDRLDGNVRRDLKHLLLWEPIPPIIAISYFERRFQNDPLILQYAHRVLEQHPVELTFFFVPQVVQALRHDSLGYVSRFIFETTKISQLFCHQIVWNMKANCYKDDLATVEDPMKPMLDEMTDKVVASLSGEAKEFYDREFGFFNEVTSISGKLKPYIKKTKQEKKAKIDEEMAKIQVEVGVYLPSNPDGKVVDIDRKSGRPLQSHAKAPFMATFKVRKERTIVDVDPDSVLDGEGQRSETHAEYDIWQQAIFKVGDDCRQDVLALQVIAMFKNIFTCVGLTLYLYPYRVTATGPGCGVIDVVPNATSRDEMGRATVNDLMDFFVANYGGEHTVAFQQARLNFIQSMAAYSVACYILQIKDRHNGNIMIDGEGHIVHIDFGFLFDIDEHLNLLAALCYDFLPFQGVKFEPSSFKLTHEMVVLMGGRPSQGYGMFQQLTVKAFLALRPYADQLISAVQLMLETGLPSFKGESTIKRLRDRFALGLSERHAADLMMGVVRNAHENVRSTAYDEFQRLQNGIPYK